MADTEMWVLRYLDVRKDRYDRRHVEERASVVSSLMDHKELLSEEEAKEEASYRWKKILALGKVSFHGAEYPCNPVLVYERRIRVES